MHILVLAWLYVTFTMALTLQSVVAGAAIFLIAGLGPVALAAVVAARRRSMRMRRMDRGDDRHAEGDQ